MATGSPISLNKRHEIAAAILSNPTKSYATLAAELDVSITTIDRVVKQFGLRRVRGAGAPCRKLKVVRRG